MKFSFSRGAAIGAALVWGYLALSNPAVANQGRSYTMPPSHSTYGYASVISDEDMKKCVELYNQAKWLSEELDKMQVNEYSESSVNAYNEKAAKGNLLVNQFNRLCAGKQSESACAQANALNRENGLPEVPCTVKAVQW